MRVLIQSGECNLQPAQDLSDAVMEYKVGPAFKPGLSLVYDHEMFTVEEMGKL